MFAELTITELLTDDSGAIAGAFGYKRDTGEFVLFRTPAVVLATGGIGKSFKVTSNSWEYTGDGHALALRAGSSLLNMEFVQFHPTGMVWPPSVKGILVTESVRGDGGVLRNSEGKRFMFDYVPDVFRKSYAETEDEADRWYSDPDNNKRPPELLPRDEVARAINSEVKAGRGSEHGGVFLDVSTRLPAEEITRRLPSMHHQFKELADVDITKEPMEVGPTCHYVMGGVQVDPDTAAAEGVHRGQPPDDLLRRQPGRDIEEHAAVLGAAPGLDLGVDRAGHLIAGQQFGRPLVVFRVGVPAVGLVLGLGVVLAEDIGHVVEHEPLALGVAQHPAVAAHRFGHQDPLDRRRPDHASGVELDEFHVEQAGPGAQRERMAVPVYSQELEVTLKDLPMPPVASTTAGARNTTNRPVSRQ